MRAIGPTLELSASDLSYFLACRHRTALDLAVAQGIRAAPSWVDPALVLLQERGLDHERRYVEQLLEEGLGAIDLTPYGGEDAVTRAEDAMRAGADLIIQPALRSGHWFGRPDLLRRVAGSSRFGAWSYEVVDTKLTKETRGGTILQLALYSDLLQRVQAVAPERFHVVTPDPSSPVQSFRVQDFAAYFRLVRSRLDATTLHEWSAIAAANYPEPVEHCDVCRWWSSCDKRRRNDDHLALVAGISHLQTRELRAPSCRPSTIFFATTRRFRRSAGSSCRKRGAWPRPSACSRPRCSTKGGSTLVRDSTSSRSRVRRRSKAPAFGRCTSRTKATRTARSRRRMRSTHRCKAAGCGLQVDRQRRHRQTDDVG